MATIKAQGTTLSIHDGVIAQAIAGVTSFSGFDGESTEIDITTLSSTAKEFSIGLEDFGSFSAELIFDPDDPGQTAIAEAKTGGITREIVLTLPSGTLNVATFDVVVKSFGKTGAIDGIVTATANFKITGSVVWS